MDIPKLVIKGVGYLGWYGLGGRVAYRGLRTMGWNLHDRLDPGGAGRGPALQPLGRNIDRDRIRREWGGGWAEGLPDLPDLTMEQRMEEKWNNNDLPLMSKLSPADLRAYHDIFFRKSFLEPCLDAIQHIIGQGPNNPLPHLYRNLNSEESEQRNIAANYLHDIYKDIMYRSLRYSQFREKLHFMKEAAKKVENANQGTLMLKQWYKMLHGLNDDTLEKIFEQLLKLLTLAS